LHGPPNLTSGHAFSPDQFRRTICTQEIDLGLTITEHMHMRRSMIIDKDDYAQTIGTQNGNRGYT
jgi:hypothetical protein